MSIGVSDQAAQGATQGGGVINSPYALGADRLQGSSFTAT
jgi:hypothetical protein